MKVTPIALIVALTRQGFWKFTNGNIFVLFLVMINSTCEILGAISGLLRSQMIFEYGPIFREMKFHVAPIRDEIYPFSLS